jgi:hypothetical protein
MALGMIPEVVQILTCSEIDDLEKIGLYNGGFDRKRRETPTEKVIECTRIPLVAVTVKT